MKRKQISALLLAASVTTSLVSIPAQVVSARVEASTKAEAKCTDLIISEYLEGSSNNKAIELFNGTTEAIDLSQYQLVLYTNGKDEANSTFELNGTLEANETYVISGLLANDEIKAKAQITSSIVNFNGDDTLVLKKGEEVVDSFGQHAFRPEGGAWKNNDVSSKDMTLVRKSEVVSGDTDINNAFDPSVEWVALPKDDISNLGIHEMDGAGVELEGVESISAAEELADGEEVTIRGIVSFNDRNKTLHIQDKTGAISISNYGTDFEFTDVKAGDEVQVTGKIGTNKNLRQVIPTEIEVVANKEIPSPKALTIKEIKEKNYDSYYVEIKEAIVDLENKKLTQGEDVLDIYFIPSGLSVKTGDTVNVVGTVGRYSDTIQIYGSSCTFTKVETETPEVPEVPVDKVGPTISKVTPTNSTSLGENRRPEITATFEDESGIDMNSIKLSIDGQDVTADIEKLENSIEYAVKEDLKDGSHTVKLEISDTLGNITTKSWKFNVGTLETNLYFGQLHSHTNLSDGQGSIDEAYTYAKDVAGVDFVAVTDHSNWLDNDTKVSMADGSASEEWKTGLEAADKHNKDDEFVAIYGFEMTWSGSTGGYGHINTFNTPGFETRSNSKMNLSNYYKTLKDFPESLSQLNHPGKTFGNFSDYAHYDVAIDELVTLIEVGNGEGAIGSSGYFPSYEEYTRALDKGWHVSPTNNQDNHKGKWGNANTARTVIEATDLSRDSIYEAISERRTYATEDENLRISYKVNGNTMGSILDDQDSLKFEINVEDIDGGDNIKKISIIGDGGKVVKSIDNINATTKTWEFTLDENVSSYYYVRVDQADKDIAVTAPVWVGERENVGLSTVDCDTEVVVENEEVDVIANIYNNEAKALENVKVEYYINGATEPKVLNIDSIESGSVYKAKMPVSFDKAGDYTVEVKVIANVNGAEREFKGKIEIEVVKASQISKVVIDGAHQNQYVTGDYAGKITALTGLTSLNGIKLEVNESTITEEVLEGASLLILSDPQSRTKAESGLAPQKYSEDELAAIAKFAKNGGNIIITSKADYGDAEGEYGNAAQGNSVLEAIGAKIRFNDDQAIDKVEYQNQTYRLYLDDYNTDSEFTKGVEASKPYSFYSGSTLIMPEDKENIEIIINGHTNTEGSDADKQGDNKEIKPGEMVALAAETLESGARVIVSGATLFSDFEIDDNEKYSNYDIMNNILNTLAPAPQIPVSNIEDVRVDANNDNIPDIFGEKVVIEGYVTAASNAAANGNSFFDVIYVQDGSVGITVFGVSTTEVKLGQKVRITGKVSSYLGDSQVVVSDENVDVKIIDETVKLVEPTELSTANSMLEENEGLLTKVTGTITRIEGQNIYVNDGTGEARVYIEGYIGSSEKPGVADEWKERVKVGDKVSAIGLASEDPEGKRLRVRDSAEIVVLVNDNDSEKPEQDGDDTQNPSVPEKPEQDGDNTQNPQVPVKPENGENQGNTGNNGSSEGNGESEDNDNEDLPNTGNMGGVLALLLGSALAAVGLKVSKKKN